MKKLNPIPEIPLKYRITWQVCRWLLFIWGALGLLQGYTSEFLQALFAIAFTHLWDMFQLFGGRSFITKVDYRLQTKLNIFICLGCVIGSTLNNRTSFTHSDLFTHFLAGWLAAEFGSDLAVLLQYKKGDNLSPALAAMFGLAAGVTISVGWEFYEFTMDRLYGFMLQTSGIFGEHGIVDTMVDLIFSAAGSLTGMFITAFSARKKAREAANG